jgi:type III secretion protein J
VRVLGVLILLAACSSGVADGLDERQSQEALAALSEAGIAAERVGSGEGKGRRYRIEVGSSDSGRAAAVLRSLGLPRAQERGFAETYGSASMIPSPTEERARFLKALSGEIANHLEQLEGVVDASVIVTAPVADPLAPIDAPRGKPTASVLLKVRGGAAGPAPDDVRKLVAGAVEGLATADVAVVREELQPVALGADTFWRLGPIRVARSSRGALIGILGGALALVIAMGAWVVISSARRARA